MNIQLPQECHDDVINRKLVSVAEVKIGEAHILRLAPTLKLVNDYGTALLIRTCVFKLSRYRLMYMYLHENGFA